MAISIREAFDQLAADVEQLRQAIDAAQPPSTDPVLPNTIMVLPGQSIQEAIDRAEPGTTIRVTPGADYAPFVLRKKATDAPIRITAAMDLPAGRIATRGTPPAVVLPRIARPDAGPFISADQGAHDYIIEGFEVANPHKDATIIRMGSGSETSLADLPQRITFDRLYIHANPATGGFRVFAMNCRDYTIRNSCVLDFWYVGRDNQAVVNWNGPGPGVVENNWLEASGENLMMGGADSKIPGVAPSLASVRDNVFFKPQEWRAFKGSVKNLFELKNCWGAVIERNVFDGCWIDGQSGHGVVFTPRNQGGTRPDSQVRDIDFRQNVIRNVDGFAMNLTGWDDLRQSARSANLRIDGNLVAGCGAGLQVGHGWNGLQVTHNTFLGMALRWMNLYSQKDATGRVAADHRITDFIVRDNLAVLGKYTVFGDGIGQGTVALDAYAAPGYVFTNNLLERSARDPNVPFPVGNVLLPVGTTLPSQLGPDYALREPWATQVTGSDGAPMGAGPMGIVGW